MAATVALSGATAGAQPAADIKPFVDTHYYDALRAEPRAARIKLLVPAWSKEFPDSAEAGARFAWQITLGRELPIVAVASEPLDTGRVGRHEWGFGLWFPVAFFMIEDFKDPSNPIVDTDYRFGFMTKFQYGIQEDLWLGIRFVPWAHESTHLGDEYVIVASRNPDFERVDVSYEFFEYGISLERERWTVRHGGISPWGNGGYYSTRLLGSDVPTLTQSKKNYEPSFGAEYRWPPRGERSFYVSVDTRYKLQYAYHLAPGDEERRQWSTSFEAGRTLPEDAGRSPLRDYFVQVYYGVNPYGQLRSQRSYWSVGIGWVFGF